MVIHFNATQETIKILSFNFQIKQYTDTCVSLTDIVQYTRYVQATESLVNAAKMLLNCCRQLGYASTFTDLAKEALEERGPGGGGGK